MKKAIVSLSIVLALGACSRAAAPAAICGPDCVATMKHFLPANTPTYAPIYGGGWIDSTSSFANGGVITYTVPAKPDDVARFYDGAASSGALSRTFDTNAWKLQLPSASQGPAPARVLIYAQAGTNRNLYVNIDSSEPGFTKVALVYGAK
ncbi:MAG TPA: hypothetical protein VG227_10805 [Caulobacteraceae bacterium]|nr:hypothetical protein [Caulobacteraceae bacterium]